MKIRVTNDPPFTTDQLDGKQINFSDYVGECDETGFNRAVSNDIVDI